MALLRSPVPENPPGALSRNKQLFPVILITSLFFFWGFVHNLDPILIPHLRKAFQLNDLQSSLIDASVFIAYFLMAIPAGIIMRRYGYRTAIIIGLLFFSLGCFLFIPAANTHQYIFFLGALFIIACGLTFLETAANPYITILGDPASSTRRLNFAQSFNGLAATLAPIMGGFFILSGKELSPQQQAAMSITELNSYLQKEASSVKMPYLILGIIILLMAMLFYFIRLPDSKEKGDQNDIGLSILFKYRHLKGAVLAQFFYVGAQVCIGSFFIRVAQQAAALDERTAATYLGFGYGLFFMAGRFAGTFLMKYVKPPYLLAIYGIINCLLTIMVMSMTGMIVVYALIGIAFFMSIMFPTIFGLGIKELGTDIKTGSSLIVMSIVGGALLPPALGYISDTTGSIQLAYVVPLICFAVVSWYGISGYRISNKQVSI